jgi:hypothetical protein
MVILMFGRYKSKVTLLRPTPVGPGVLAMGWGVLLGALLFACERPLTQDKPPPKREVISWEWLNPRPQGESLSAAWVKSSQEAYFASPSALLHTKDSGGSWALLPLPRRANITRLWGEGRSLYALSQDRYQPQAPEILFASDDLGITWQERAASTAKVVGDTPAQQQAGVSGAYYEAQDGSARYLVDDYRISLSLDGGLTQRALSTGGSHRVGALSRKAPAIFQVMPSELYAVTASTVLWGEVTGRDWVKSAGEPLSTSFAKELCAGSTRHLFCYDKTEKRLLQFEHGKQLTARELPFAPEWLAGLGELLLAQQSDGALVQSRDQGTTWQEFTIEQQRPTVQQKWSLSPSSLYLRVGKQLWYTQDSGASWKRISFFFLPEVSLFEGQGTLFVIANGEVYFLSGITWDIWRDSLQKFRFTEERAEGIFFGDAGEILVATTLTTAKAPSSNRLLISDDDGLTWRAHLLSPVGDTFFNYDEQRVWVSPSREVFVFGADLKIVRGTFHPKPNSPP